MAIKNRLLLAKREELLEAARENGAVNVRVFGSVARGEDGPDSDFDFLIDLGPVRPMFFPGGVQYAFEEILGRKVDVVTEGGLPEDIKEEILRDALPL